MPERSDIEDVWGEIVGDAFTPSQPLPPPPEFAGAVDEEMRVRPSARLPLHVVPLSGPDSDAVPIEVVDRPSPARPSPRATRSPTAQKRRESRRPQSASDALAAPQVQVADPVVEVDVRPRRRTLPPTMRTAAVRVEDDLDVALFEVAQTGPYAVVPEEVVELDVADLDVDADPSLLESDGRTVIEVDLDDVVEHDDAVVAGEIDVGIPAASTRGPDEPARSAAIANAMRGATVRVPLVSERKVKTAVPSVSRVQVTPLPGSAKATTVRTTPVAMTPARPQATVAAAVAEAYPTSQPAVAIESAAQPVESESTPPEPARDVPAPTPTPAKPSTVRVVAVGPVKPATMRVTPLPAAERAEAVEPIVAPSPAPVAAVPPPSDPPCVERAPSSSVSLRRIAVGEHVVMPRRRTTWVWLAGAAAIALGAIAIAVSTGGEAQPDAAAASAHRVAAAVVRPEAPSLAQTPVDAPAATVPVPPVDAPVEAEASDAAEPADPQPPAVDAAKHAAGLAYVAAVERYETDRSNEALEAMVSAACEMDDGPRARSAFRKLRGGDQRTRVMVACRERGIDLWARVDGPTASELLVVAERQLAEGDYEHALQSARESNHVARNNGALLVMGIAQCKLGRPTEADELERHLPPRMRRDLELACAKS